MKNKTHDIRQSAQRAALLVATIGLLAGCHQDMWNQPRYTALQTSTQFTNQMASRPDIEGTMPYANLRREWWAPELYSELALAKAEAMGAPAPAQPEWIPPYDDAAFYTGKGADGAFLADNYFPVTRELIERGRERFAITCSPCHGLDGYGGGYIISRGFPPPTSYHIDRLREEKDGYFFDVITNGFGRMYPYKSRVQPEDRWAIVAYIRALQASQNVDLKTLPEPDSARIQAALQHPKETDVPAEPHHGGSGHGH